LVRLLIIHCGRRFLILIRITGLLAVGFEKYGSEEKLRADAITHLYEVYVKINADGENPETGPAIHDKAREFFVAMEAGSYSFPPLL
jgi:arginyl-tRNA synthetase